MNTPAPAFDSRSRAVRAVLAAIDRCRPPQPTAGRAVFQARFLVGACLLATLVALGSVVVSVWDGDPVGTAMLGVFLLAILVQLAALRLGASVAVLTWTLLLTVGAFLVAMALVTRELLPEQLFWLTLLPLCTLVLGGPRADAAEPPAPTWPTGFAVGATLAAGVLVVVAHEVGFTLGRPVEPASPWSSALNFALFLSAVFGLVFLYAVSARETQAELDRLRRMLSVCAWCGRIRDQDDWLTLEGYMTRRNQALLTHGICPSCREQKFRE
ncbi:MAG: hypothetical protein U0599_25085 [Vicinamibacteria bacterium]